MDDLDDIKDGLDPNIHCFPPKHSTLDHVPSSLDDELYQWAWIIIGMFALVSTIISLVHFFHHLRYYHKPHFQRHITRILLICPIYAIDSFFSFRLYWLSVFINAFRDCYEGFIIYNFFCLLIHMLGGPQHAKNVFDSKPRMCLPVPFCCARFVPSRETLATLQRLTLQYVLVKPLGAILACVLHALGFYCPGNLWPTHGYLYISGLNFVSVSLAMYALIVFYVITQDQLKKFNPIPKFIAIKSIIFVNFWQSVLISALVYFKVLHGIGVWTTDHVSTELQNALVCFEMLWASLFLWWAFSSSEYRQIGRPPTSIFQALLNVLNVKDVWEDTVQSFGSLKYMSMYQPNARKTSFSNAEEVPLMSEHP